MKLFKNRTQERPASAPYLAMAFFCERIDTDGRGLKTFVNAIDTLRFNLKDGETLSGQSWAGMVALDYVR